MRQAFLAPSLQTMKLKHRRVTFQGSKDSKVAEPGQGSTLGSLTTEPIFLTNLTQILFYPLTHNVWSLRMKVISSSTKLFCHLTFLWPVKLGIQFFIEK
jgi:hypothetical protein